MYVYLYIRAACFRGISLPYEDNFTVPLNLFISLCSLLNFGTPPAKLFPRKLVASQRSFFPQPFPLRFSRNSEVSSQQICGGSSRVPKLSAEEASWSPWSGKCSPVLTYTFSYVHLRCTCMEYCRRAYQDFGVSVVKISTLLVSS